MNCIIFTTMMNPCPCGHYPDRNKCRCTPYEVHNYLSHISGPILDRIDICVTAPKVEIGQLQKKIGGESSDDMRKKVLVAHERQTARYKGTPFLFNSDLGAGVVEEYCLLGDAQKKMIEKMFQSMDLSARAYHKILKVARTIADLEDCEQIMESHLAQAACYRTMDKF